MPTTPNFGLPYPTGTDPFTPRSDLTALATTTDTAIAQKITSEIGNLRRGIIAVIGGADGFTLASGVEDLLRWTTVERDTDNMVDLSADPHSITIPTNGVYEISANFALESAAPYFAAAHVVHNGGTWYDDQRLVSLNLNQVPFQLHTKRVFTAGDVIQIGAYQSSGSDKHVVASLAPVFTVQRVAD